MSNQRGIKIQLSGFHNDNTFGLKDTQQEPTLYSAKILDSKQNIGFIDIIPQEEETVSTFEDMGKRTYNSIFEENKQFISLHYANSAQFQLVPSMGLSPLSGSGIRTYSYYRREVIPNEEGTGFSWIGEWEPVIIGSNQTFVLDYNIANNRYYQYIIYPTIVLDQATGGTQDRVSRLAAPGDKPDADRTKVPSVSTKWDWWILDELIPVENPVDTPTVQKTYKVQETGIWMFKFNLEGGEQTQNFSKNEFLTLGQFPKFSTGAKNYLSGSLSCLIGSVIEPPRFIQTQSEELSYFKGGYTEKPLFGTPLSSNRAEDMLEKWREICYSGNPKLLRDIKGQKRIVQIVSNNNSTMTNVQGQPDVISFTWTEVESLKGVIITD